MQRLPEQGIRIYNENNLPIYIDDSSGLRVYTELLTTIRQKKEIDYTEESRQVIAFTFEYHYKQYVIVASGIDEDGNKELKRLRDILFFAFIISLITVFICGFVFSKKALAPLSDLSKQAENITFANLGIRLKTSQNEDEIYRLTESFNKMLDRLQLSLEVQKSFLSNVSHELRTPLSVMLSTIDIALLNERDANNYKKTLEELKRDLKQLSELSDKLIELAQTSYDASKINFELLRVDEVLWDAKTETAKRYPENNIVVQTLISVENEEKLIVKGDKRLLTIAIVNLLDNACKFSKPFSPVNCELFTEAGKLVVCIKDQGIGMSAEDQLKITQPFFRASSAKDINGFGLGLTIAETILKVHHISLTISSATNQGTRVTLLFN